MLKYFTIPPLLQSFWHNIFLFCHVCVFHCFKLFYIIVVENNKHFSFWYFIGIKNSVNIIGTWLQVGICSNKKYMGHFWYKENGLFLSCYIKILRPINYGEFEVEINFYQVINFFLLLKISTSIKHYTNEH